MNSCSESELENVDFLQNMNLFVVPKFLILQILYLSPRDFEI